MIRILFLVIASLGLLLALGTVLARNLVHAALYLVGFFFLVACMFVMLQAEFMAAMQVLVYIGAVAILFIFGIMLTRNIQGDETTGGHWARKLPAVAVSLGLFYVLAQGIFSDTGSPSRPVWAKTLPPKLGDADKDVRVPAINDMSRGLGIELMTRYMLAFEVAGLLLTAALVGAVALAQSETDEQESRAGARAGVAQNGAPGVAAGHAAQVH